MNPIVSEIETAAETGKIYPVSGRGLTVVIFFTDTTFQSINIPVSFFNWY
jgi:hypothetical protein